ncbi:MAG TPA: hypothetical protein VFS00_10740 [Polyangiaceae bacterium]|nr:hypothetical protein [Polyangiaceae bacterium]
MAVFGRPDEGVAAGPDLRSADDEHRAAGHLAEAQGEAGLGRGEVLREAGGVEAELLGEGAVALPRRDEGGGDAVGGGLALGPPDVEAAEPPFAELVQHGEAPIGGPEAAADPDLPAPEGVLEHGLFAAEHAAHGLQAAARFELRLERLGGLGPGAVEAEELVDRLGAAVGVRRFPHRARP